MLDFPSSRNVRNQFLLFIDYQLQAFCYSRSKHTKMTGRWRKEALLETLDPLPRVGPELLRGAEDAAGRKSLQG
jgi:hypothetical protein